MRAATLTVRVRIVRIVFAGLFLVNIFFKIVLSLPDETVENVKVNSVIIKKKANDSGFSLYKKPCYGGQAPPETGAFIGIGALIGWRRLLTK